MQIAQALNAGGTGAYGGTSAWGGMTSVTTSNFVSRWQPKEVTRAAAAASFPRPDAVHLLRPDEKQFSSRGRGGRVVGVAQVVDGQNAKLRAALDHVAFAGAGEEEPAAQVGDGAGPGGRDAVQALGVHLLARRCLHAAEDPRRVQAVQVRADDNRRGKAFGDLLDRPAGVGGGDVAGAGRVDGEPGTAAAVVEVDHAGAVRRRRRVAG